MKVLVTRQNQDGTFDEVGMNNRLLFSHYKTERGALRRIMTFWCEHRVRVEFFHDRDFLNPESKPFKTVFLLRRMKRGADGHQKHAAKQM